MVSDKNFGDVCDAYISPKAKWKNGNCNLATNIIEKIGEQKKVNPIKKSKRSG